MDGGRRGWGEEEVILGVMWRGKDRLPTDVTKLPAISNTCFVYVEPGNGGGGR